MLARSFLFDSEPQRFDLALHILFEVLKDILKPNPKLKGKLFAMFGLGYFSASSQKMCGFDKIRICQTQPTGGLRDLDV